MHCRPNMKSFVILLVCFIFITIQAQSFGFLKQRIQGPNNVQTRVVMSAATGTAHLITGVEKNFDTKRSTATSIEDALAIFLAHAEIGITDPRKQLIEIGRQRDPHIKQWTIISYQQLYEGLIVESALLKVTFNEDNAVVSSSSTIVPDIRLSIVPTITEQQAIETARKVLTNSMKFDAGRAELKIYRTDLARGVAGTNHLAYHVILTCVDHHRKHFAYVDAHSGVVLNEYNPMHHALSRQVNQFTTSQRLFSEGDSTPVNAELRMLTDTVYQQYNIMNNVAGWRSWDLKDGTFIMEVNVTTNSMEGWGCPNAMFYIDRSYYCPGMGYGADVSGHEWGHGYSDTVVGSGGFVYQYQSGALSESYADIIGETVQLLWKQPQEFTPRASRSCTLTDPNRRWIIGDQITNVAPALNADGKVYGFRDMYNPNCYGDPAATDDSNVWCKEADGGGVHANSGITNQAYALFADGGVFNSVTFTGVGLVKAFHIYMRGLSKHVPSTTFSQHADYVMAACNELATNNVNLADPLTGQPSGLIVSTTDCSTLASVFSATKMKASSFCGVSSGPLTPGQVLRGPFPSVILPIGMDKVYWETSHFLEYQNVQCRVGNGAPFSGSVVQTQWSEYSYCPMPALNDVQSVQLYVSYNGTEWFGPYEIAVIGVYGVSSYSPSSGALEGGTMITVQGQNFVQGLTGCNPDAQSASDPDCAVCFFGNSGGSVAVPATVVSSTQVTCTSPPWQAIGTADKSLAFSLAMNYYLALGPFEFTYTAIQSPVAQVVNVTKTPINFDPQHGSPVSTIPAPPAETGNVPVSAPRAAHVSSAPKILCELWLLSFIMYIL